MAHVKKTFSVFIYDTPTGSGLGAKKRPQKKPLPAQKEAVKVFCSGPGIRCSLNIYEQYNWNKKDIGFAANGRLGTEKNGN